MSAGARILRLGVKELRSIARDRMLLGMVVVGFSVMIYLAAGAATRELHDTPIAFVDEDGSPLAARLQAAFQPPHFKTPVRIDPTAVDPGLDGGIYTFVLDIPPGFERDLVSGRQPTIQVNIDATRVSQAFIGAGYVQRIVHGEIGEFLRASGHGEPPPLQLVTRIRFNPNLSGAWFGGLMEVINHVTMFSIILTGAALIREREHGTLEHLLVMPLSPFEVMAAKVWANGLVIWVAAGLSLVGVVRGVLGVPIAGSIPLFLLATMLHLFSTTSIGILLATVARSMPQLTLLIILVILPMELLSGGVTPRESMPVAVRGLMSLVPTTHYVALAQAVLFRGAGLVVVWPQLAAIGVIGAIAFGGALLRFRRAVSLR